MKIKTWLYLIGAVLFFFMFLSFCAGIALGYPENIRMGYSSCASCHVSPTGGGVLTPYGRATSAEMSTWGVGAGEEALPTWLALGGDARYINVTTQDYHRKFLMQADAEAAVSPVPGVWLAASAGIYGEEQRREYRRNYLLIANDNISLRAGRFFPAYGVMHPDHTAANRGGIGWNQGTESFNAEAAMRNSWGELVVTSLLSSPEQTRMGSDGYLFDATEPGLAARGSLYLGKSLVVGGSYWYGENQTESWLVAGPFLMWGLTRHLYLLAELDRRQDLDGMTGALSHRDLSWSMLGYEVYRGVHVRALHEYERGSRWSLELQLLPVPHAEILYKAQLVSTGQLSHSLVLHTWL